MHQNKIRGLLKTGSSELAMELFSDFYKIRCVAPSMANTAIERKSGANPACKSVRPNSVDGAACLKRSQDHHYNARTNSDKKALTGAYFIRFFSADAIKRIIKMTATPRPSDCSK